MFKLRLSQYISSRIIIFNLVFTFHQIPICLPHSLPSSYFVATPPTKTISADIVVPFVKLSFVNTRSIDIPDFPLHNIVFQKFRYRIVPALFSFIQCQIQFYRRHNIPRINWFRQFMFSYIIIILANRQIIFMALIICHCKQIKLSGYFICPKQFSINRKLSSAMLSNIYVSPTEDFILVCNCNAPIYFFIKNTSINFIPWFKTLYKTDNIFYCCTI